MTFTIDLAERGLIPDVLLRKGVRLRSRGKLSEEKWQDPAAIQARKSSLIDSWRNGPIAIETQAANEQHYELPPEFFALCLGQHLKYSSGYWPDGVSTLDECEAAMLKLSCERAELADGMRVLDLGCGWGSVSLWIAEHYPNCEITAVSNSSLQRERIEERARALGTDKLNVVTADINDFQADGQFDRIMTVEMLEHVRNHAKVFERAAGWLKDDGQMFIHVFCHRELLYPYEDRGDQDWMTRYFFSGGIMPSFDLFLHYQDHLRLDARWWVPGTHYEKTSNAWLECMDSNRDAAMSILLEHYSNDEAHRWFHRWRLFYLAVAEFFGLDGGTQWGVGHYRLRKR